MILPHNTKTEMALIGAIMMDPVAVMDVCAKNGVTPDWFYDSKTKAVADVVWSVVSSGRVDTIDALTMSDKLRERGKLDEIGHVFIESCIDACPTAAHCESYIDEIGKQFKKRRGILLCKQHEDRYASDSEPDDVTSTLVSSLIEHSVDQRSNSEEFFEKDRQLRIEAKDRGYIGLPSKFRGIHMVKGGYSPDEGECVVISGRTSHGKCLGKDVPVIMYDGSKKMSQDVKNGDVLMGPDGTKRTAFGVHSGTSVMYRIKPLHGDEFTCNGDHILLLTCNYKTLPRLSRGRTTLTTVDEYMGWSAKDRRAYRLVRPEIVTYEKKQELKADPYFIGLWLGDGSSNESAVTTADAEIKEYLLGYAESLSMHVRIAPAGGRSETIFLHSGKKRGHNKLLHVLREYGIAGNKHIPDCFLKASAEERRKLLAGLIDSDGYTNNGAGEIEYSSIIKRLAEDVCELARSLGFKSMVCKKVSKIWDGRMYESYRTTIFGDFSSIPIRLKRKQVRRSTRNQSTTSFTVENIGVGDYYGFALDGDHLFMLGDYTITHNTLLMTDELVHWAKDLNVPVGLVELDMSERMWRRRTAASIAEVNSFKFDYGNATDEDNRRLDEGWRTLNALPLHVTERRLSIGEILAWATMMRIKKGIKVLAIDHLTKIRMTKDDFKQDPRWMLGDWVTRIQDFGKRFGVLTIILSQSNTRDSDKYLDRTPAISGVGSLKESGAIEENADGVITINKKPDEPTTMYTKDNPFWEMVINIAKNRARGPTGLVPLFLWTWRQCFCDYSRGLILQEEWQMQKRKEG